MLFRSVASGAWSVWSVGWVAAWRLGRAARRRSLAISLAAVTALALVAVATIWVSLHSIQQSLPEQHLMKERDFSAYQLDVVRLRDALALFAADPQAERWRSLCDAADFVSARSRDTLATWSRDDPAVRDFVQDIETALADLDNVVARGSGDAAPAPAPAQVAQLRAQLGRWDAIRDRARAFNDGVFQSSMEKVSGQSERLNDLREYLLALIGLIVFFLMLISVSLVRTQRNNRELVRLNGEIRALAYRDSLTRVANRRMFSHRLGQFIAASARARQYGALLYLDLDNFKSLNDSCGHRAGDELLIQVAQRVSACVRENDTVARLGGDEFVVLLENLGVDSTLAVRQARVVAEKVREALSEHYCLNFPAWTEWRGGASIGITVFTGRDGHVEHIIKQADAALYKAKGAGRGLICFFDPSLEQAAQQRVQLESELQQAIAGHQFELHYQPVVNLDGAIVGAEALVRWRRSLHEVVEPSGFIPLCEETGLIVAVGEWVLAQACRQWVEFQLHTQRPDFRLSINVSARQIQHDRFVETIGQSLAVSGLSPSALVLEVTETVLLTNEASTRQKLQALRRMGVGLALDDFGTHYSSLSLLQTKLFTEIKIDRSFVHDIGLDPQDEEICAAMVALAHKLRLEVVVEGVETDHQLDFFRQQNDRLLLQGYLFARPLPLPQLIDWVRDFISGQCSAAARLSALV